MRFHRRVTEFERPQGARGILPLIAAAIAAGGIRAGIGLLQGRDNVRRQRNQIQDAYTRGQARMGIQQQDVRQSEGESLGSRGLTSGGDVQLGGAVAPGADLGVGGAHTLGGQQQADLHREQGLEQNNMLAEKNNAVSNVEAGGSQDAVNSIASGISTGFSVAGMGQTASASPTGSNGIASAYANPNYFNGVHPTNPDMNSDWSGGMSRSGTSNAAFNIYGGS
jgi:hypothetical protein